MHRRPPPLGGAGRGTGPAPGGPGRPSHRVASGRGPVSRSSPAVAALGGGHGLAATLRAARRFAGHITAVVSVADDGGSSGRLRRQLGIAPPGDLRKCLVALADAEPLVKQLFEHRFTDGSLGGHSFGNL
ncbi:MAG TPA: hypothetical protein DCQ30_08985, partial [Acidimicrobiaceae bacterium]|nr:hypothetical protein [Acidimicrobiaceae bacterium]